MKRDEAMREAVTDWRDGTAPTHRVQDATAGADAERRQIVEWLTDFDPSFADAIESGDHWPKESDQ